MRMRITKKYWVEYYILRNQKQAVVITMTAKREYSQQMWHALVYHALLTKVVCGRYVKVHNITEIGVDS